jgi:hypothetical protein
MEEYSKGKEEVDLAIIMRYHPWQGLPEENRSCDVCLPDR